MAEMWRFPAREKGAERVLRTMCLAGATDAGRLQAGGPESYQCCPHQAWDEVLQGQSKTSDVRDLANQQSRSPLIGQTPDHASK